ncbi:nitroreductase [Anoxybacterium hadale]|uniref:Nitroreductase n=1 Tax=Anoxybacterium hadale TaxID=3408580 RepID=A0ACD1ABZ6_9FIRM|nr:nitroreductase [Clostridiales bacterium]
METMKTIAMRQSCREYTGEQLTESELKTVLEAANASPVGMGKFEDMMLTVVQKKDLLEKLDEAGAKFYGNPDMHPLYGAPTVIIASAKDTGIDRRMVGFCNAACMIENMALAATDLGLGSVYLMGSIMALGGDSDLKQDMKIPADFIPASAIALGATTQPLKERDLTVSKVSVEYLK